MRMPRAERGPAALFALLAVGSTAVVVATSGGSAAEAPIVAPGASAWRGLVGSRPDVALGNRAIVVLRTPSLAQRVEREPGPTVMQERTWSSDAATAQRLLIARLAQRGVMVRPDYTFTRVLDGFSASLDPSAYPVVEADQDVAAIYPVRAAFPASISTQVLSRPEYGRSNVGVSGFDGRGVRIALLDTGVDSTVRYLHGRVLHGIDVVGGGASPLERHGTEMAGLLVGSGGPSGLSGVAPGASVLPIRVAGRQPDGLGHSAIYARSDQIVAGLERAVDPNNDGDAHDAVRIALLALAEPFAGFDDSPEAQAVAAATALNTLVVVPSGNDGASVSGYGDVAGPGGAPAALTVGAVDTRARVDTVRVLIRSGLQTILDRTIALAGAARPGKQLDLQITRTGAALVRGGASPVRAAERAVAAGALAVLLYGSRTPLPAGGLGLDESVPVPVVSVWSAVARAVLKRLAAGGVATVTLGNVDSLGNVAYGRVASFSSSGLAYDGRIKPELTAPGVGLATSDPGAARFVTVNGSSAAAAVVAGTAALVAQARPRLGAVALKNVLVAAPSPRASRRPRPVDLIGSASLSNKKFSASDQAPTLLSVDAGRVIGEGGRVDIRPVQRLDITLSHANGRPIGLLVRVRDLLPGRYAFGITGRGPNGDVLAPGTYRLTISAYPVAGGPPSVRQLRFSLI